VIDAICDAIEAGANYADAAASAKVAPETLDKWRAAAKQIFERVASSEEPVGLTPKEMRLFGFYKRFLAAEGNGAVNCATVVYNAAMKDPEWALRWLERRRPQDWKMRVGQDVTIQGTAEVQGSIAVRIDPADELREFINAIIESGLAQPADDAVHPAPPDAETEAIPAEE